MSPNTQILADYASLSARLKLYLTDSVKGDEQSLREILALLANDQDIALQRQHLGSHFMTFFESALTITLENLTAGLIAPHRQLFENLPKEYLSPDGAVVQSIAIGRLVSTLAPVYEALSNERLIWTAKFLSAKSHFIGARYARLMPEDIKKELLGLQSDLAQVRLELEKREDDPLCVLTALFT